MALDTNIQPGQPGHITEHEEITAAVTALQAGASAYVAADAAHVNASDPHSQYLRQAFATIGNGESLTYSVTHNFNTRRLTVQVFETSSPFQQVFPTVGLATPNTVVLTFSSPPAVGAFEVVVQG